MKEIKNLDLIEKIGKYLEKFKRLEESNSIFISKYTKEECDNRFIQKEKNNLR